jgi:Tfp pilus assembly protein PilF
VDAAAAIGNVGTCLKQQGELAEAAASLERALADILDAPFSLKTTRMAAWTWENLGAVRKWQSRIGDALRCHVESLLLFSRIGDVVGQGTRCATSVTLPSYKASPSSPSNVTRQAGPALPKQPTGTRFARRPFRSLWCRPAV